MRILLVNKFWYPKGGSERYTFLLKDFLEARGHEVIPFAMEDERNLPTPWAAHFVPHVDFWEASDAVPNQTSAMGKFSRVLWNRAAARALEALIAEAKPDVAHLQNFAHQISPSILPVLRRHGIPVVWTLHDYKLLCPNYRMYTQGNPCERCKGHNYANAIRYNCMGNYGASAAVAMEMYLHHVLTNVYGKCLDVVIAPSAFLAGKLGEWGWKGRIEMLPHFVNAECRMQNAELRSGGPVLFVGRLVEEKGIEDFVEAARRLPEIPFEVIGNGPIGISNFKFQISNCQWRGSLLPEETAEHLARAAVLVVPSRWYENAPYVVLEAMAAGVPVIATRIGGLPELVRDGETGILVPPRDPAALAKTIESLYHDGAAQRRFGARAREIVAAEYGPERHAHRLTAIYQSLRTGGR